MVRKGRLPRFLKCETRSVSSSDIIRASRPTHQESSLVCECAGVCACAGLLRVFRCQRSFQDPNVDSRHAVITQSEYRRINKHPRSPGHNSCFVCSSGGGISWREATGSADRTLYREPISFRTGVSAQPLDCGKLGPGCFGNYGRSAVSRTVTPSA